MHAERFDAMVSFAGCDKSLPGMMMAAARLQRPDRVPVRRVDAAGQPQRPGARHHLGVRGGRCPRRGRHRRRGARRDRTQRVPHDRLLRRHVHRQHDGLGGRGARPVASRVGVGSGGRPSPRRLRLRVGHRGAPAAEASIRPRDILTKAAFENAIAVVMALGGSTNAVLHLLAIAHEARVELELDDFNKVAARCPHLADTKPHGKYDMLDIDRVGGVPVVMAMLAEAGVLHLDEITVTGHTVGKNLDAHQPARTRRRGHPPAGRPDPRPRRHRGADRLAGPQGLGREGRGHRLRRVRGAGPCLRRRGQRHGGRARRSHQRRRHPRHPLRGPEGRPGHARDARHHGRHEGRRPGRRRGTHHRRPVLGGTHGFCIGHVAPEAVDGGPIAFVEEGDRIRIDVRGHTIDLLVDDAVLEERKADWKVPEPRYPSGVLAKYAKLAQGAEKGAVTLP